MNNSRELAAVVGGALIGGIAGYLFFTERGRGVHRQIEPALEDISRALMTCRKMVQESTGVVSDAWRLLDDALREGGKPTAQYSSGEASPF